MACMKCGSDWVTPRGKNMVSCPECCKQQRCKARKQGRLPAVQRKSCGRCGNVIEIDDGSVIAHTKYCDNCQGAARAEYMAEYRRQAVKESTKRRRLVSAVLSVVADVQAAMRAQLRASVRTSVFKSSYPRCCATCGKPFCPDPRHSDSRFCSCECASAWQRDSSCMSCGCRISLRAIGRNARKRTSSAMCKRCAVRKFRRSEKGKEARRLRDNHRKRCRLYGVPFDPGVKPQLVFERDGYVCHVCGQRTLMVFAWRGAVPDQRSPTVDHHPYPLSVGVAGHEWHNVRCACWGCNVRKSARVDSVAAFAAGLMPGGGNLIGHG